MDREQLNQHLSNVVENLVKSVNDEPRLRHLNLVYLPNRDAIIQTIQLLRQIIFPGYFGQQDLTSENLPVKLAGIVSEVAGLLYEQVRCCLRYRESIEGTNGKNERSEKCDRGSTDIVRAFLDRLPAIRSLTATDVQAAFDSDPAAQNTDETIFSYPGVFTITVQRLAHEFYKLGVPLLPRIMTEYAHSLTGIDIHPGAQLGKSFFIDHGTGVVIGESTIIGENVKIYQGVTLGALAPAYGQMLRGTKRHPTLEDNVTIYAGVTILGGDTIIGKGSVIGGNVFITSSVPPLNQVSAEPPLLKYRDKRPKSQRLLDLPLDFQI